jgi:hypothetical protein
MQVPLTLVLAAQELHQQLAELQLLMQEVEVEVR